MKRYSNDEDYNEQVDVEIRQWLEYNELPLWFVEEMAERYLNVVYIRNRIRELFPVFLKEITPLLERH